MGAFKSKKQNSQKIQGKLQQNVHIPEITSYTVNHLKGVHSNDYSSMFGKIKMTEAAGMNHIVSLIFSSI